MAKRTPSASSLISSRPSILLLSLESAYSSLTTEYFLKPSDSTLRVT
jgi:hypothetical protein